MKTITIHLTDITASDNQLKISIPGNLGAVKTIDAVLNTYVSLNSTDSLKVNFSALDSNESVVKSWENVDYIKDISSGKISIDISDEFQTAIDCECPYIVLNFVGTSTISFSGSDLKIDYTSLSEFQANGSSHNIDLGKSGKASIDLATGRLSVSTPIVLTDSKTLPLSISANYHSVKNDKIPNTGMPDNWHLNVSQFLIKEETPDGSLLFTYVDENGKNQIIEEKYYYLTGNEENPKEYVSRNKISINLDGEYIFEDKKIKTELVTPSGLKLVSSIADISGSQLVDFEPEELIKLKDQINQIETGIRQIENSLKMNKKNIAMLVLAKEYLKKQTDVQKESINNNKDYVELQKKIEFIRGEYLRKNRNFQSKSYAQNYLGSEYFSEDIVNAIYNYYKNNTTIVNDKNETLSNLDVMASKDVLLAESSAILMLGYKYNQENNEGSWYMQNKSYILNNDLYNTAISQNEFATNIKNELDTYHFEITNSELNNIYDDFKGENTFTLSLKDFITLDLQIENAIYTCKEYMFNIKEQNDKLTKLKHQQKQYELQVPVHYLYNDSNTIYGFGKTLDVDGNETNTYRLILITDAYENTIFISYDSLYFNRINSITDTSEKLIKFEYDSLNNYIKEIVDTREEKTSFVFDNTLLKEINHNGQKTLFSYNDNSILQGVLSPIGVGAKFTYSNQQIVEVQALSVIEKIEHNLPVYKSCYQNNNSTFIDCLIDDNKVNFIYNNYKSTSVSNKKNKTITYLFDKYGKVRCIYENSYTGDETDFNPEEFSSNVTNFDYQDNNVSFKASKLPYSINYLEDVHFDTGNAVIYKESLSLGSLTCGADCIPYTYPVYEDCYSMPETKDKLSVCLSKDMLSKINNISCSHKTFVLSGWAKSDAAFVMSDEKSTEFPNYIQNRKFEIRAEITYTDGATDKSQHQVFDWRNTEWQYCALPITLDDKTVAKMECFIDYSNNTNIDQLVFTDLELKQGDYEKTEYNSDNLQIKKSTGHSEWEINYTYDENQKLICETIVSRITNKEYSTHYEYNKNGKLIKSTDYNDVIKETIYNDKGSVIKTLTYHKDEPANIIYEETILDDKGKQPYAVNEFGEKLCDYEYVDDTGNASSSIDTKGVKTSYGYDSHDTLLQTTTTIKGEENTNIYGYTLDMLTSLTHNNFDIKYAYDDKGRKTKINIADKNYLKKIYGENEEITFYKLAENEFTNEYDVYKHKYDNNGNVLDVYYKHKFTLNKDEPLPATLIFNESEHVSQNIYDVYGNLLYCKDLTNNAENIHRYDYDNFGQVVSTESTQHGVSVSIENEYDQNHSNITNTFVTFEDNDSTKLNYSYILSDDPNAKPLKVNLDQGVNSENSVIKNIFEQEIKYDKLNRVNYLSNKICTTDKTLNKEFTYLKKGNYTSNLVSKINFATNAVINDNLSYKYDEKGNIIEVRQYNKLVARYKYDSLSRIVREDNKEFDTTTTFEYDAGGNILCKKVYDFTIVDNLDFEDELEYIPYTYPISGWRDQLQEFKGEKFVYDEIGNPTTYRNKTLVWSHGRQLDKYSKVNEDNIEIPVASYTYNANGIRTSKTYYTDKSCQCESETNTCTCQDSDCFTTKFFLNGNKIIMQHDCCNDLTFYYGVDGITGFHISSTNASYDGEALNHDFYYKKNLQGDIIGIIDTNGEEIVKYVYDAWGNHKAYNAKTGDLLDISKFESYTNTGNIIQFIAIKNPFRYRSYYYDFETGLYYLNSRYYDPELGRFINADDISVLSESKEFINGLNLYSYCNNNPIMHSDKSGAAWWDWLIAIFIVVAVVVATVAITIATGGVGTTMIAGALIGAGISGITSTITQLATTGTINPFQLFADMAFGAITGLIGGSALGVVSAGITMGATGFASSMVTDLISTGSVNYGKAALMAVVTGLLGAHAGAQNGLTSKTSSLMNSINTVNNKIKQGLYSLRGSNGARNILNYHISKAQGILTFQSMNKLFISIIATNYAHESIFNELINGLFK